MVPCESLDALCQGLHCHFTSEPLILAHQVT